jgi:HSP20 family protein
MTLVRYSKPINVFPNLINEFFNDDFFMGGRLMENSFVPSANVKENSKAFLIELSAPGFNKKDINIEVDDIMLKIYSEIKNEVENKDESIIKREFHYNSFERSFQLPENVNAEKIKANYNDGILSIEIPKMEKEQKKKRLIDIF